MSDSIPNTEYTIGWIAALTTELVAASEFLDKEHNPPTSRHPSDTNNYTLGSIGPHNVVMACLPTGSIGTTSAAVVATHMINSFPNVRLGLMVGIGGGAPRPRKHNIRLGDVVVSSPVNCNGGVLQYDFGKTIQTKEFQLTGSLNQPPTTLLTAVSSLRVQHEKYGHQFQEKLDKILKDNPRLHRKYSRPPQESDRLYRSHHVHPDFEESVPGSPEQPNHGESEMTCKEVCGDDPSHLVPRGERGDDEDNPAIHYGLIASANQIMKDALVRDHLAKKGVLCFEMEAAGLMNTFPCLVIRGICDYSDSHKNDEWQGYAAMMAAAYAKDLLQHVIPSSVAAEKSIKEVVSSLEQKVDDSYHATLSVHTKLEARDLKARIKQMQDWLCPADASTNANLADKLHHPGTCAWLLEDLAFRECCSGSRRQLWLHALAGCGKTVLCAAVLEHLTATTVDGRLILKFFFDFRDPKKQTLDAMLRSLVFQTYRWQLTSTGHSAGAVPAFGDQPTEKHLQDSFCRLLVAQKEVFVVLDALDESTTKKGELLKWIKDMRDRRELRHVRLVFTSRPEPEFERNMPHLIGEENCVQLDKEKVNADIRSYITAKVKDPPDFVTKHLPEHLVDLIIGNVGDRADGMFRWAECQLEELAECATPKAIEEALQNLPKAGDLKETYDRMMAKIPNKIMGDATRLLQFLVHAKEPLSVNQAMEVVATQVDLPRGFDPKRKPFNLAGLLKYCPGLVRVESERLSRAGSERLSRVDVDRRRLSLAHFSVKEYLLERAGFTCAAASRSITWACLIHLSRYIRLEVSLLEESLRGYAWRYWMCHAAVAMAQDESDDIVEHIAVFFFHAPPNQQSSVGSDHVDIRISLDEICVWGFDKIIRRLLQIVLARHGHSEMVHLLDRGDGGRTPLMAASAGGHGTTVKLLLDNGAKINAGYQNETALTTALRKGDLSIVQQLLDAGAEVNPQAEGGPTALVMASRVGCLDFVQKLLDAGAKINAVDAKLGTALEAASVSDHLGVVRYLLDRGANVNVHSGSYGGPLVTAANNGCRDVVQLLLDMGADVDAVNARFGTALAAASASGHLGVVRYLLDQGANVNVHGGTYGTPLIAAANKGRRDVVQLLLDMGADVDAVNARFGTALTAALEQGHPNVVRHLLDRGANVKVHGSLSLQFAVERGYVEAVRMLLNAGVDVSEDRGDMHPTLLDAAETRGFGEIARLLRIKGATSRLTRLKEAFLAKHRGI
ncbi:hypothetical protein RB595_003322 [Gaeumannomyces hyphopodioides]